MLNHKTGINRFLISSNSRILTGELRISGEKNGTEEKVKKPH